MKQQSVYTTGFELTPKRTRKRECLKEMNLVVPWARLVALISPYAPSGKMGSPPFAVGAMLRIHFMQQWFGLRDPAMEEALHDVPLNCQHAQLEGGMHHLLAESSILRFRHLLEEHKLSLQIKGAINATLAAKGLLLKSGTVVDATLTAAPNSTKNKDGQSDPAMHQSTKGNQWHLGMKAHVGVDADSGLLHSVTGTTANVNDVTQGNGLLHGDESVVFADACHQVAHTRPEAQNAEVDWQVSTRPCKRRAQKNAVWGEFAEKVEKPKVSVRAKVEHPFREVKCQLGHAHSALSRLGQERRATGDLVRFVEPVDGPKGTYAKDAPGMSVPAARTKAQEIAEIDLKNKKSAANSALVSPCEHSRVNSRCGGGYAYLPSRSMATPWRSVCNN